MNTTTAWKQDHVFSLIAFLIRAEFERRQRPITSHEIARALRSDAEAQRIIDSVVQQRGDTRKHTAINMVAWWNARWTHDERAGRQSDCQRKFKRTGTVGDYAYKPVP